ncbi:MAG: hypothetical protein GXX85_15375, partial [Ignavibacteria bacterium]|nr:hypothetical protein [Ignavibacteria bacterium]
CEIPSDEISKLTTDELLSKCINYQYMSDILFHNEYKGVLDIMAEAFNGLDELFKRNDAANTIINYYTKLKPEQINYLETPVEKGKFSFNFVFLELYLTQPAILKQLEGQEKTVIKAILKNVNECLILNSASGNTTYSGYSLKVKCVLIAKMLEKMNDKSLNDIKDIYPEFNDVIENLSTIKINEKLFERIIQRAIEL